MFHHMLRHARRKPDVEVGLLALDFEDDSWIRSHHRRNLIERIVYPDDVKKSTYRINISELQRVHLRKLQHRLLQHAVDLRYGATEPADWASDLRQYVQALQDHEYMGKFIWQSGDPFIITGERYIDRCMLDVAMKDLENDKGSPRQSKPTRKWEDSSVYPAPIGGTRDVNCETIFWEGFFQRMLLAILGGIFLVGPMWLMVLHNTLYTALITTTVCILIFGVLMALSLTKPMDVMASTAAYAAVLVVFVGLTVDGGNAA
ncbi:hypothetical protein PFICI_14364 [Pestalotiopsis fici W106-1]|uniref:DUF6594 domain-containing protein n=1 Tax=Pestalotiopsis fici (strain W106-1 / CGMCC3.15140) TaxID=1229662 RepID=W3WKT1_PESFW|nr:uncharacterized protein PFICI_14364 [Pestalotiopsis fici W106-1]ETS74498.1 hypothetical protein PFICI_14364 [Pestalotiopsis fici W106-1]